MHHRFRFRLRPIAATLAAGFVLATAGTAAAHIEPDFSAVPAGAKATITFNVEHGCAESPTTKLEVKVPAEVTDAQAVDQAGWTGSTAAGVVTLTGGPAPAHEAFTFAITFTAPDKEGTVLRFPIIQTCQEGHTDWISTSESDDHPAPVLTVGKAGATPTTAPAEAETTVTTEAKAASTTTTTRTTTTPNSKDDSNAPVIISGIVAAVVVLGGGAILAVRMRKAS
ncbi:MAG: hypothetical protein JWM89_365 [Acidimicrobiales bacterium]|nr:hypothetical protein [Acidimicrobiales bacterium]